MPMKYFKQNIFLAALILTIVFAIQNSGVYAQFTEDFSDGDFTNGNAWSGTPADFIVNTSNELQLNNTIAAASYLSTPVALASLDNLEWQLLVKQTFAPSGSNYGRVYLVADQADVTQPLNGYFLQFGEAGSTDAIELFRQDGGTITSVARGTDGLLASSFTVRIRVRLDAAGNWEIATDHTGGTTFVNEATGNDATYSTSAFTGVYCLYTVSNANKFYYDDFYIGNWQFDTTPPAIVSATVTGANTLDVLFSEDVDLVSAETAANYSVDNGVGVASTALRDAGNPALVHLTFGNSFVNGQNHSLTVTGVQDLASNTLTSGAISFFYLVSGTPSVREVVVNEIFADPSPQLGLPDAEFIELYNSGTQIFDLAGWKISDGSTTATLGTYVLLPGEYVVICSSTEVAEFFTISNLLGVSSWPSLNNSGDMIELSEPGGSIIDKVIFTDDWYGNDVKKDGGYSLEQINPLLPCSNKANWTGSNDANGGTPALVNSVYNTTPDVDFPILTAVIPMNQSLLKLVFNEGTDSLSTATASYVFSGGISVVSATPQAPVFDTVLLVVSPLITPGTYYNITVNGVQDCSGNTGVTSVQFVLPETPIAGDLIINELLFDPQSGGTDFVEVYNISAKILSLKNWYLANYDNDTISNLKAVDYDFLLKPGAFVVLSKDSAYVKGEYPFAIAGSFIEMSVMPSYNNDSSTVYLITPSMEVSDRFSYTEDMHYPLLTATKGVTLERISYNRSALDKSNWHSAAESQHFGTPGYENSQFTPGETGGTWILSPEVFSPDNDGTDDILAINYTLQNGGAAASIRIFDAAGRLVKTLLQNELLGTAGGFSWDGINNNNEKVRGGIYIVQIEWFYTDGSSFSQRHSCVVAHKN
jgi:hypothetical protein